MLKESGASQISVSRPIQDKRTELTRLLVCLDKTVYIILKLMLKEVY